MRGNYYAESFCLYCRHKPFYTSRDKLRWKIDFKKLKQHIQTYGEVVDCIYYTGQGAPPEVQQEKFTDLLSYSGYSIEQKTIKTIMQEDGKEVQKANVDIELELDMFNTVDNYDMALLFSGDGDFERPMKLLRARGKQYRVFATHG